MADPIYSERGFKHFDPLISGEDRLRVYESSDASAPHIWLRVNDASIHLDMDQISDLVDKLKYLQDYHYQLELTAPEGCCCLKCGPPFRESRFDKSWRGKFVSWMALCPYCGNKRCPGALSHNNKCSNSNDPNQPYDESMENYVPPPWRKAGITEEEFMELPLSKRLEIFFADEEVTFGEDRS